MRLLPFSVWKARRISVNRLVFLRSCCHSGYQLSKFSQISATSSVKISKISSPKLSRKLGCGGVAGATGATTAAAAPKPKNLSGVGEAAVVKSNSSTLVVTLPSTDGRCVSGVTSCSNCSLGLLFFLPQHLARLRLNPRRRVN